MPEPLSAPDPAQGQRRLEYEVTGAAAAELATVLVKLRKALDTLIAAGTLSRSQARPLEATMEEAARIVMHGRLLAKVAGGSVRQSHSQTSLDQILRQALDKRMRHPDHGMQVQRHIKPVAIFADKDMVTALVDAVLDWVLAPAKVIDVSLEIKDWPAHALLRVHAAESAQVQEDAEEHERLSWHLITELCRAIGATLDRVKSPGQTLVMIEFARTVREMDGVSAMEVDIGAASGKGDSARVLAGHRALIISSDFKLREEIRRICQDMGLEVDSVPSSQLAAQRCQDQQPDVIVVDERFNDERFSQLRTRLLAGQANFPMIEIAYSSDAPLSLDGWGSGGMTKVSRAQLASQLPQALALEMSKIL